MHPHLFSIEKDKLLEKRFLWLAVVVFLLYLFFEATIVLLDFMLYREGSYETTDFILQHNIGRSRLHVLELCLLIALRIGYEFQKHIPQKHLSAGLSRQDYFWMKWGYAHVCWLALMLPTVLVFLSCRVAFPEMLGGISWWKGCLNILVPSYGVMSAIFALVMVFRYGWFSVIGFHLYIFGETLLLLVIDPAFVPYMRFLPGLSTHGLAIDLVGFVQRENTMLYVTDHPWQVWLAFVGYVTLFVGFSRLYTLRRDFA